MMEARHAETQARTMSEDARREMELKWKTAQEAWKVRSLQIWPWKNPKPWLWGRAP